MLVCRAVFGPDSENSHTLIPPSAEFRELQDTDQKLQKWITHQTVSKARYQPQLITVGKAELWSDIGTGTPRILVPTCLQRTVFDSTHRIAHPGPKAGYKILKNSYRWPGMGKDALFWAK